MSIRKILYPLDFSGTATSNRIEGELKTIGVDRYRAFTLNFAPFFTNTLTIKERGKTKLLVRGTDYECLYFYPELTKLAAGKEVCGVVVITNAAIGIDLEVGYNTVGGHYAHSADVIQMAITALELDNRNVYWEDVIDTPTLFQPAPHMHDIGDVYGMEFQIDALVALREAILVGDNTVHQQIYDRIDNVVLSLTTMLNAHRADIANPHKTTAHQVNAYTREEIDAEIAAIMSDLADLEPRFQAIATTFTQIQQQYTSMTSSLAALSTRVGTVENEQSKFYLLLATINQTLAAHQVSIDAIYVEIASLKEKDANLQTQIDGLKTRAGKIEEKNTEQDGRLDDIEEMDVTQNGRLDKLETFKTAAEDATTGYDARLDALETWHTASTNLTTGYDARLYSLETWKGNQGTWNTNTAKSITDLYTRLDTLKAGSNIGELVKSGSLTIPVNVDFNGNKYNYYFGAEAVNTGWQPTAGEMYMIVVELSGLVIFSGGCIFGGRNDTVQHSDTVSVQYADSTSVTHPENGTTVTNYMVEIPNRTSLSGKVFGLQLAGSGKSEIYRRGYTGAAICSIMLSPEGLYIKPIYSRHRDQPGNITATYKIYKLV